MDSPLEKMDLIVTKKWNTIIILKSVIVLIVVYWLLNECLQDLNYIKYLIETMAANDFILGRISKTKG